MLAYRVGA